MKILVVGGTGGFGSVICRFLADDGHEVFAASRHAPRTSTSGVKHVQLDRRLITPVLLSAYDLVVDAAGPFQGQDLRLVDMAMTAKVHYLDICDDREFLETVISRDNAAKQAKICVISGASSVPSLSSAAALEITSEMDAVERVDISISASATAVFGRSVLLAMLSGAGRPVPRRQSSSPLSMTKPRNIRISSPKGDLQRQVLVCDAPDVTILPPLLKGNPEVRFRAGSELSLHNMAMQLIAKSVQLGLVKSGTAFRKFASAARRLTAGLGSGRSGMLIEAIGKKGSTWKRARWSLVAENGTGPMIPCLTVPVLVRHISEGKIPYGARSAAGLLSTHAILERMSREDYRVTIEKDTITPVYERASEHIWQRFAPAVRAMHNLVSTAKAYGTSRVSTGRSPFAKLICFFMGFPKDAESIPVEVTFHVEDGVEIWSRKFGDSKFSSQIRFRPGGVEERFGPLRFHFLLEEVDGSLRMIPDGWSLWRIPLPYSLAPNGIAQESESPDGRFHFNVPIRMPFIGKVVHYEGTLSKSTA